MSSSVPLPDGFYSAYMLNSPLLGTNGNARLTGLLLMPARQPCAPSITELQPGTLVPIPEHTLAANPGPVRMPTKQVIKTQGTPCNGMTHHPLIF
ncbi:hypothetical protein GDO86_011975 [Hymenochirus boettgeri]|uniref:Uncharacterized protein n=1 Tax=Hymenochirus boettgeri TaxID=247094 RepID=A0A8T2JL91_9PIPI|nr:hypothetical protein GDO86_011975 [Hymenochirus boettgeri]